MIDRDTARTVILDLMEECALEVAGVIAAHRFDDEAIWKLMRGLDGIRKRTLQRMDESTGDEPEREETCGTAHPAVEEFLVHLQRDRRRGLRPVAEPRRA
jgi:tRNA(Ile)-lysidine synthase TilS/MesJ